MCQKKESRKIYQIFIQARLVHLDGVKNKCRSQAIAMALFRAILATERLFSIVVTFRSDKVSSIKFRSKHSIVLVLCLLRNLMEQTLNEYQTKIKEVLKIRI